MGERVGPWTAMSWDWIDTHTDIRRVEIGARAAAVAVVLSLSAVTGSGRAHPLSLVLIMALAVLGSVPVTNRTLRRWRPIVEALLAGLVIATTVPYDPALLPYLVVPSLSAGLLGGWRWAVTAAGASSLGLMTRGLVEGGTALSDYLVDAAQWSVLALSVGLLAAWVRRIQDEQPDDTDTYAQASRLLVQLRDVARQLSGGLDRVNLAQQALQQVRSTVVYDRATFFALAPNGVATFLAHEGLGRGEWLPDLDDAASPWSLALSLREPVVSPSGFAADSTMLSAVVPVRLDDVVGLVGLERHEPPFTDDDLHRAQAVLDTAAVRLDAAVLFDEVRGIATAEERRRLAREIHDGIAQELASVGYAIDDLAARATELGDAPLTAGLSDLRQELSRVVTELRLSIFDLRSEVGPGMSLTAALAENARALGTASGLTVHLDLAESPQRLRVETEAELLRIAQEAMANARRHARAANLWVTCHVDPPSAVLWIEDDGRGLAPGREDSFGIEIMRERAQRIGAGLTVDDRPAGGVSVAVVLGPPARDGGRLRDDDRAARR
jgi:signal transduction histidine kinase